MVKKKPLFIGLGTLTVLGLGVGYFTYNALNDDFGLEAHPTVQSNYFQTVNYDWLQTEEIPSDQAGVSAFGEIQNQVDKALADDIDALVSGEIETEDKGLQNFISYYKLATDFEQREKDGVKDFKEELDEITALKSFEEIFTDTDDMLMDGFIPFGISIVASPNDSTKKILSLNSPSTFLGDPSYYEEEVKDQILPVFSSSVTNILKLIGYSEKEAEKIVSQAIKFDELLVPYQLTSEEASDDTNVTNIVDVSETKKYSKQLDFQKLLTETVEGDVQDINVVVEDYFKDFDELFTTKNFENYKSWLTVLSAKNASGYLTEDIRQAAGAFELFLTGAEEIANQTEAARTLALGTFGESTSVYYGKNYFGDEAREEVEDIATSIIEVYKERLSKNDWLSDATKKEAIKKLDSMTLNIGYPDKVTGLEEELPIDENLSFFENTENMTEYAMQYALDHFSEPIDKENWSDIPSYTVNAFYDPSNNSINFPAAILSEPFYGKDQSDEEKYGGIATVIGHEITHAFDSNGALYDENGNLNNWWTDIDKKEFEKRTDAMVQLFDGYEIFDGTVNGKLTVTENTADAGGLSASLEALMKKNKDADKKVFFESYAKIWQTKMLTPFAQYLLTADTHAPAELRVNLQVANMPEFYEVYDVKEGDPMYIAPENRVSIW